MPSRLAKQYDILFWASSDLTGCTCRPFGREGPHWPRGNAAAAAVRRGARGAAGMAAAHSVFAVLTSFCTLVLPLVTS